MQAWPTIAIMIARVFIRQGGGRLEKKALEPLAEALSAVVLLQYDGDVVDSIRFQRGFSNPLDQILDNRIFIFWRVDADGAGSNVQHR